MEIFTGITTIGLVLSVAIIIGMKKRCGQIITQISDVNYKKFTSDYWK